MARPERFELPTFWFVARRSIQLSYGRVGRRILWTPGRESKAQGGQQAPLEAPPSPCRASGFATHACDHSQVTTPASAAPLLTLDVLALLDAARRDGSCQVRCSLDLMRSMTTVDVAQDHWDWNGATWPWPTAPIRERTIYYWTGTSFEPVQRYSGALIKLVPSQWGAPTFEIDGIKMLPTAQVSPFEDAKRKVQLVAPRGKAVLDTCGGLGYFAHWCLEQGAARVLSFEKNPDVIWLRGINPWSPGSDDRLVLKQGDIVEHVALQPAGSVDAILHDPPRFGIAGELYSQAFYDELARVIRRNGLLFHYTGTPNRLTSGRDVPREVTRRLEKAGFAVQREGDGLLARRAR
jgi:uncharacterized protein